MPLFLTACSSTGTVKGYVGDYGIFKIRSNVKKLSHPNVVSGKLLESINSNGNASKERAILKEKTDKIPMYIGQNFHFWFTLEGLPDGNHAFHVKLEHPEMTGPNGTKSKGYTRKKTLRFINRRYESLSGWDFESDYELVEGKWKITYLYQGVEVVSKEFTTHKK